MESIFFRSYLKSAFRSLLKRKGYAFINIIGLIIGICCCLLIFHYVAYERSFDKFEQADNIYRLRLDYYQLGQLAWKSATVFPGIGPAMKREIAEVDDFCRLLKVDMTLLYQDQNVKYHEAKS